MKTQKSSIRFVYGKCAVRGCAVKWAVNTASGRVMRRYHMDKNNNWILQ